MRTIVRVTTALSILVSLGFTGSQSRRALSQSAPRVVTAHLWGNPDMLNPICNQGASSTAFLKLLYQRLCDFDYDTEKMVPILAEGLPKVTEVNDTTLHVSLTLREDAKWDNGKSVTVDDVLFTWKVVMNPHVDALPKRTYANKIRDIMVDPENPRTIIFVGNRYVRVPYTSCAEFPIIPAYCYDPRGLLKDISYAEIVNNAEAHKDALLAFANGFNVDRYSDDPQVVSGSGSYEFVEWKKNISIVFRKKKKWWGKKHEGENCFFTAKADEVHYLLIKDPMNAKWRLNKGEIDAIHGIRSKDYLELQERSKEQDDLVLVDTDMAAYSYVGINCQHPYLNDKRTRQALAHLLDIDKVISDVTLGFATPLIGTVLPFNEKFYHKDIQQRKVDIEKAKKLLAEAGWEDTDSDGILDKEIDGEREQFTLKMAYNSGNHERKTVLGMLAEQCKKVGIRPVIIEQDWFIFIDKQTKHDFMVVVGAWILEVAPDDPHQLFHSESADGGSNYPGWSTPRSDEVIDLISLTIDDDKRAELWLELQEIMHEEVPYIFMSVPRNKMAFSKRVNAQSSRIYPGYWAGSL